MDRHAPGNSATDRIGLVAGKIVAGFALND
jgi:hypothetical protein